MDKAFLLILPVIFILEDGLKIVFMVKELIYLQVDKYMMECYRWIKSKELVPIIMIMELHIILEIGIKILNMEEGFWIHHNNITKANGIVVQNMEMVIIKIKLLDKYI